MSLMREAAPAVPGLAPGIDEGFFDDDDAAPPPAASVAPRAAPAASVAAGGPGEGILALDDLDDEPDGMY